MISRANIESRLGRLEHQSNIEMLFVVSAPADQDFDVERFLRKNGHAPVPRDLVVCLKRFADCPAEPQLISAEACR